MNSGDTTIAAVKARAIYDSRGRPTVEAEVTLRGGATGRASAPSGASTGRHEAHELRDGDPALHGGLGVSRAVHNVRAELARHLVGLDAGDQRLVDRTMLEVDGEPDLARLGANAVLATSLAVCRAGASALNVPLHGRIHSLFGQRPMSVPLPMVNILSGGAHAGRGMDVQDFLVVPVGARDYDEALRWCLSVRLAAAELLAAEGRSILLADEGGLSPGYRTAREALELMLRAFERARLRAGVDVAIALDVAASELLRAGRYELEVEGLSLGGEEMVAYVSGLAAAYPIVSIEDPLDQDDWEHWHTFTVTNAKLQIVGDDLFVTNPDRIARGATSGVANAALVKVNQNGTLTGTFAAIDAAVAHGFATVVSARSGETEDAFIADLAVAAGAGQIKIGSVRNSERMAKYNQLARLDELGLPFAGAAALA